MRNKGTHVITSFISCNLQMLHSTLKERCGNTRFTLYLTMWFATGMFISVSVPMFNKDGVNMKARCKKFGKYLVLFVKWGNDISNSYELNINILRIIFSFDCIPLQLCSNLWCETGYFALRLATSSANRGDGASNSRLKYTVCLAMRCRVYDGGP